MREESIHTFLKIVEAGTISGAAEALFTTQSNISKQMRQLEREIGVPLLYRHKGKRHIELTAYGEKFLHIARKWETLQQEFIDIPRTDIRTEISIGATDLINNFTFKEFYKIFMKKHPSIRLDLHTHHSKEIYNLLATHKLDIGFAGFLQSVPDLSAKPLYQESLVVLNNSGHLTETIKPAELNPDQEIYAKWSDAYETWHDSLFPGQHYQIHCGTGSMVTNYLQAGSWAIVPISLAKQYSYPYQQLSVQTPAITYYLIRQNSIRENRLSAISLFIEELSEALEKDPKIKRY